MEGLLQHQVKLVPHQAAWDEEFLHCRSMLLEVWGDNVLDIQHVGSTAVPSICAKPILDVAVRLKSMAAMDVAALTAKGYSYEGPHFGSEEYQVFVLRKDGNISLHHIHCYGAAEPGFDELVGFRDYLNEHLHAAKEYERIKFNLAEKHASERHAYTKGKGEFIRSIYAKLKEK